MELIKNTNFDFIGLRKYTYIFSLVIILLGAAALALRGRAILGIDFTGGDMLQVEFNQPVQSVEISELLKSTSPSTVQSLGTTGKEVIIKSGPDSSTAILAALEGRYGAGSFAVRANTSISATMGASLTKRAATAFAWGMLGILLYLTIRFEFRFAVTAILAILHDMLIVTAALVFAHKQIDSSFIAALLTIAGYSVNDTVIIFDRIRENIKKTKSGDYVTLFNRSINETLSRTVITVLTVLFVVSCLFFFGGESLNTFSFTLLIGFAVGTFSSVFVASSLLVDWNRISPHRFNL